MKFIVIFLLSVLSADGHSACVSSCIDCVRQCHGNTSCVMSCRAVKRSCCKSCGRDVGQMNVCECG